MNEDADISDFTEVNLSVPPRDVPGKKTPNSIAEIKIRRAQTLF
jgi:hypothetical protein